MKKGMDDVIIDTLRDYLGFQGCLSDVRDDFPVSASRTGLYALWHLIAVLDYPLCLFDLVDKCLRSTYSYGHGHDLPDWTPHRPQ